MKFSFNPFATGTEKYLWRKKAEFRYAEGGFLLVTGSLSVANEDLAALPNLSKVIVAGDFDCSGNRLTTLEGAPHSVGGNFTCAGNALASLDGAPREIGKSFDCSNNILASLRGGPESVGGNYSCNGNPLETLEGAPVKFHAICGDFGRFTSWRDVPSYLRGKEQEAQQRTEDLASEAQSIPAPAAPAVRRRLTITL